MPISAPSPSMRSASLNTRPTTLDRRAPSARRTPISGVRRAKVKKFHPNDAFFMVEVEEVEEQLEKSVELEALVRSVHSVFEAFVKLNKRIPPEMLMQVASIDDPARPTTRRLLDPPLIARGTTAPPR